MQVHTTTASRFVLFDLLCLEISVIKIETVYSQHVNLIKKTIIIVYNIILLTMKMTLERRSG